jgi:hypothetical protein
MGSRDVYVPYLAYAMHLLISLAQCDIATVLILISAWVRFAGTSRSLPKGGAYTLILIGQVGNDPQIRLPPTFYLLCFL